MDQAIVKQIADGLELEFGIAHFLDEYSIPVGEEFLPWIEDALEKSKGCAIFLGENGWGPTHFVEAQKALLRYQSDANFKLIPVVLGSISPRDSDKLGSVFKEINWVRITESLPELEAVAKLRDAIFDSPENYDNRPIQLTPYLLRREAKRWQKYGNDDVLPRGKALAEAQELLITSPELTAGVEVARFLQAASRKVASRLRRLIAISLVASVMFAILAVVAYQQYIVALSRERAALALTTERPDHALMVAVGSYHIHPTAESRSSLLRLINNMPKLKFFLHGASVGIRTVDIDESSRWAVAAGEDANVYLWDIFKPEKEPVVFPAPPNKGIGTNRVHDLQINSSGTHVVVGYERGAVQIWSLHTGTFTTIDGWPTQDEGSLKTGTDYVGPDIDPPDKRGERPVTSLSINSDQSLAAAIDSSGRIFIFDIHAARLLRTIYSGLYGILTVDWAPGGDFLLTSDGSGNVRVFDIHGNPIKLGEKSPHRAKIVLTEGLKNQNTFLTLDQMGVLNYWRLDTKSIESSKQLNLGFTVFDASLDPNYEHIYLTTREGSIRKISLNTYEEDETGSLDGHRLTATSLRCRKEHSYCVSGGVGGDVVVWDLGQRHPLLTREINSAGLIDSFWDKGSDNLGYIAHEDGAITWNSLTGSERIIRPIESVAAIAARDNTDEIVLAVDNENAIWLPSLNSEGGDIYNLRDGDLQKLYLIAVSDDGKWLVGIGNNNTVAIWQRGRSEEIYSKYSISGTATRVKFSPHQESVVVGTVSGEIYSMYLTSNKVKPTSVKIADGPVFALAFLKSGDTLFVGSGAGDRNIRALEYPSLQKIFTFPERHSGSISNISVSPNERFLASASDDGEIVLWDLDSQSEIAPLQHEKDTLFQAIKYDRQGNLYAASDHTVFEWQISDKAIVKASCDVANLFYIKSDNELPEVVKAGVRFCLSESS